MIPRANRGGTRRSGALARAGVVLASVMLIVPAAVQGDVLDFEGLTTVTTIGRMDTANATDYGGFTWQSSAVEGFAFVADAYFQQDRADGILGNSYGAVSPSYGVFNWNGTDAILVQRSTLFDFHGAFFTAYGSGDAHWTGPSGAITLSGGSAASITITGYNGGNPVGSASMSLSASQYDWLQADLFGVDALIFERTAQPGASDVPAAWWVMDDFTFNPDAVVPVPGAAVLVGGATIGLMVTRRKRT